MVYEAIQYIKNRPIGELVNHDRPYQMPLVDLDQRGETAVAINSYLRAQYRRHPRLPSLLVLTHQLYSSFQEN